MSLLLRAVSRATSEYDLYCQDRKVSRTPGSM